MTNSSEAIQAERQRQKDVEGYTPEHDDRYVYSELELAAACYEYMGFQKKAPATWPWPKKAWKPKDHRRNLVRAGALYLAAAERAERRDNHIIADINRRNAQGVCAELDRLNEINH